MDLHATLARLTRNPVFKEWHEKNKNYFLAHAFVMLDDANKDTWQIGFYNPENERMITFFVSNDAIKHTEEQEVLKSEGKIQKLRPEDVKIAVEDALHIAKNCLQEEYKSEKPVKEFFIIQNAEGHTMFNITYFTQSLKTINIKIDAKNKKILKHSIQSLAEFV